MTRAKNTASVISKHLPKVPIDTCDFLREGAPIRPEPASPNWRPEAMVSMRVIDGDVISHCELIKTLSNNLTISNLVEMLAVS